MPKDCETCQAHAQDVAEAEHLLDHCVRLSAQRSPAWDNADYLDAMRMKRIAVQRAQEHAAQHSSSSRVQRRAHGQSGRAVL